MIVSHIQRALVALCIVCSTGAAADPCTSFVTQLPVASQTKDWAAVERIARGFVAQCEGAEWSEMRGTFAIALSNALQAQGRDEEALAAARQCLELNYAMTQCHLQTAALLEATNRRSEAKAVAARVPTVAAMERDRLTARYGSSKDPDHRTLLQGNLELLDQMEEIARGIVARTR